MIEGFWRKHAFAADRQVSINTLCARTLSERMTANATSCVWLK
jgi:hypothetical protein